jgi:hypothetical protein
MTHLRHLANGMSRHFATSSTRRAIIGQLNRISSIKVLEYQPRKARIVPNAIIETMVEITRAVSETGEFSIAIAKVLLTLRCVMDPGCNIRLMKIHVKFEVETRIVFSYKVSASRLSLGLACSQGETQMHRNSTSE